MKIPLLVSMKPQDNFIGALSLVGQGFWKIISTHKDSELQIVFDNITTISLPITNNAPIKLACLTQVRPKILKAGSESSIDLHLESCQSI